MGRTIGKNISKSINSKYSQKFFDPGTQSATDALKTSSKRGIQKTAAATGDFFINKIANEITEVSKYSQPNNSETVTNEHGKEIPQEIPKERYVPPKKRQKIIDHLRLI